VFVKSTLNQKFCVALHILKPSEPNANILNGMRLSRNIYLLDLFRYLVYKCDNINDTTSLNH